MQSIDHKVDYTRDSKEPLDKTSERDDCLLVDRYLSEELEERAWDCGFSKAAPFVEECVQLDSGAWEALAKSRAKVVTHRLFKVLSLMRANLSVDVKKRFLETATKLYYIGWFEKWFKNKTTTFFSRAQNQELPPELDEVDEDHHLHRVPGMFLTGGGYVFLSNVLLDRNIDRAWTINNLKKIVPTVDAAFMANSYHKHRKALTRTEPVTPKLPCVQQLIRRRIRDVCKRLRGGIHKVKVRMPSTSAHFEQTRKDGGAFSLIHANLKTPSRPEFTWEEECREDTGPDLHQEYFPEPPRLLVRPPDNLDGEIFEREDGLPCRIMAIPEPCKARVISCGPAFEYHYARLLQKPWHSKMRNMSVFRLIGRYCEETDIQDIWEQCQDTDLDHHLSGDYSAATDTLDPDLTKMVLEELCVDKDGNWRRELEEFMQECLLGHELHYPDTVVVSDKGKKRQKKLELALGLDKAQQTWGQLMGSPLSFLVLCIVNAAACQASYDLYDRMRSLNLDLHYVLDSLNGNMSPWGDMFQFDWNLFVDESLDGGWIDAPRFLVNGDDVAGISSPDHYELWKFCIAQGSFVTSVGKNFLSKDFVTINTEMYRVRHTVVGREYEFVPYINGLLLFPEQAHNRSSKFQMIFGGPRCGDVGSMSFDLCRGFSDSMSDQLVGAFIEEWKEILDVLPGWVPWFVSKVEGGLGIKQTRQRRLSVQQKKWIHFIRKEGLGLNLSELVDTNPYAVHPRGVKVQLSLSRQDGETPHDPHSGLFGFYTHNSDVPNRSKSLSQFLRELTPLYQMAQRRVNRSHVKKLKTYNWSDYTSFKTYSIVQNTRVKQIDTCFSIDRIFDAGAWLLDGDSPCRDSQLEQYGDDTDDEFSGVANGSWTSSPSQADGEL